jgi:hypothetical protein
MSEHFMGLGCTKSFKIEFADDELKEIRDGLIKFIEVIYK